MKIILIRPPSAIGIVGKRFVQYPINLGYLAAVLKKNNFDVEIWDYEVEDFNREIIVKRFLGSRPQVIGITSMTPNVNYAHDIAAIARQVLGKVFMVIGGPHASAIPRQTLEEFPYFDAAVIGEGEVTFKKLCQRIRDKKDINGLSGIVHRQNGKIVSENRREFIQDLDSLPFPARHLFNFENYRHSNSSPGIFKSRLRPMQIFTSRGCFGKCIFCAACKIFGDSARLRSAANVTAEIEDCISKYKINHFTVDDDTFCLESSRLESICSKFSEYKITWDCDTRVDLVNREKIFMMAKAGCLKIAFGVESGSERILELTNKNISLDKVRDAFRWSKEAGIIRQAFMMIGSHPSETVEDLNKSLRLLEEIRPEFVTFSLAVPYPGTHLNSLLTNKRFIQFRDWKDFQFYQGRVSWRTDNFTGQELVKLQQRLIAKFYLNPKVFLHLLSRVNSFGIFLFYFGAGIDFLRYLVKRRLQRTQ